MTTPYTLSDFDFALPPELIAQHPMPERSGSRLLDGTALPGAVVDRLFHDISMPEYRELLRAAVTWVAGGEPAPVVAGAGTPPCVEVTVHDQAASGRRVGELEYDLLCLLRPS